MQASTSNPASVSTSIVPGSLRAEMEARRAEGRPFEIREAVAVAVPLCTQLAQLHGGGKRLFVYPSAIRYRNGSAEIMEERAHAAPVLTRDRACLAPEERKGAEGDAGGSVFAVGAILYEMLTNASVGPGMRRPAELVADLPSSLEVILGKALVADPKHRPHDLAALAQALHHVMPTASIAPPPADESHLDSDEGLEVDVSLSLLPPPPKIDAGPVLPKAPGLPRIVHDGPFPVAVVAAPRQAPRNDPTQRLADLKAALESDPRPRYVVVKDGMDHGPFSAVELLQQIAQHIFVGENALRDAFTNDERFIKDWDEFAPFAEHARLNQEIKIEKQAFEATVQKEKEGAQYKTLIGVAVIGVVLAAGLGFFLKNRADKEKALQVAGQTSDVVDVDAGLGPGKSGSPGGGGRTFGGSAPGGGSYPVLSGGGSCEAAAAKYSEEYKIGGNSGPPDLTAGAYGAVLNKGTYLNSCGVPPSTSVNVCVAVQNGRAVGVTVSTDPQSPGLNSCIAGQVRGLGFPSHPRLDITRTSFAAQ